MYRNRLFITFILISLASQAISDESLEEVGENELDQLFKDEKYVVILFMKGKDCSGPCKELEKQLLAVREELAEALGAWVVRCHAPDTVTKLGGNAGVDTIIFVRHGRPMLLSGASIADEDELLNYLLVNKESLVRSLDDDTFEHETQATTGATTGDWLIAFTREECGESCEQLLIQLETVAAHLRGRKNVAIVHRENNAGVTTRRLGVTHFPSIILFRLGHLYRYSSELEAGHILSFTEEGFQRLEPENIPKPRSSIDDFTQSVVDWLRENPWQFLGGVLAIVGIVIFLVLLNSPPPESWTKRNKRKKK